MCAIGRRRSRKPRRTLALIALLLPGLAAAVQFEDVPAARVTYDGDVPVVALNGASYYVNEVPAAAGTIEQFESLPKKYQSKGTLALDVGEEISVSDVQAVLDAWYHDTAIDYDSVRIRALVVGERRFVSYCLDMTIFGCVDGKILAGTVVTYEVNGANRSGGMTGFQPRTIVVRKQIATSSAP